VILLPSAMYEGMNFNRNII